MSNRQPQELADLEDFVDGRRGWTKKVALESATASRVFEYTSGDRAMLWVELVSTRFGIFEAHVSIPFAAGPEETFTAGRGRNGVSGFGAVKEWLVEKEKLLNVPMQIAEVKTYSAAEQLAQSLGSKGLWTMSYIFDIDFYEAGSGALIRKLIHKCNSKLMRQVQNV